jgi:large subunit ribosomal protein L31
MVVMGEFCWGIKKMAKKDSIHVKYRPIKVIMTNGDEVVMKSTYGKDVLHLNEDKHTHPAWTKDFGFNENVSQVAKFQEKFGNLGIGNIGKKNEQK